jgi:hypothetical protein
MFASPQRSQTGAGNFTASFGFERVGATEDTDYRHSRLLCGMTPLASPDGLSRAEVLFTAISQKPARCCPQPVVDTRGTSTAEALQLTQKFMVCVRADASPREGSAVAIW